MQPKNLSPRSSKLWTDVNAEVVLDASGLALLEEACRTLDIIDRLTGALSSRHSEWLRLSDEVEELADGAVEIRLVINPLLGEIRQQRLALRQMIAHLKIGSAQSKTAGQKTKSAFDAIVKDL